MTSQPLSHDQFKTVVECAPLMSMDLVVRDPLGRMLLGLRRNRPALGYWFVPGGRVYKDERLQQAFDRITEAELGRPFALESARTLGVFEHFYDDNFSGEGLFGTHYVVLAYELKIEGEPLVLPMAQHERYRWLNDTEALSDDSVHANTQAYARLKRG